MHTSHQQGDQFLRTSYQATQNKEAATALKVHISPEALLSLSVNYKAERVENMVIKVVEGYLGEIHTFKVCNCC